MEIVLALGIGALAGSGVWLILRPRTFQVIIGLVAALLRGQSLHRRHGSAGDGSAGARGSRNRGSFAIRRSAAAGACPDRYRDQLRDDGAVPGRSARIARPDRDRPRRWSGAGRSREPHGRSPDHRARGAAPRRRRRMLLLAASGTETSKPRSMSRRVSPSSASP